MIFMGFFCGLIGMGLDKDMLDCLSTMQSYCLLSIFARGVDNLFGDKTLLYKNNWRVEVAKCDNSQENGDRERDGDGGEVQYAVKPNKLPANYNHFIKSH